MKCEKHNIPYVIVGRDRGKTEEVCPKCEEESIARLKEMCKDMPRQESPFPRKD